MAVTKTNACRLLDGLRIAYELRSYAVDPADLTAPTVAAKIGLPAAQVWKTLVVRGDRQGVCFALIAGDAELAPKALAALRGDKKADLVPLAEVQPLTGYVRGGVTALGAKKAFPVVVDAAVRRWERIAVSAGVRGLQIIIAPDDYIRATRATTGEIARPPAPAG